jgi:hypothetical protein
VLAGLALPLLFTAILVPFRTSFPNTDAALALMLAVVGVAAAGNRLAGILAAVSAAVWFDFFLTRPYERFAITRTTDIETTVLILVIGIAVTELAVWGRREHLAATRRAGYLEGINAAAEAVAAGNHLLPSSTKSASSSLICCRSGLAGLSSESRVSASRPGSNATARLRSATAHGTPRTTGCRPRRNCLSRPGGYFRAASYSGQSRRPARRWSNDSWPWR